MEALPVALPLLCAALLAALGKHLHRWITDLVSIGTVVAVAAICARLFVRSRSAPVVYWLGGWYPRQGVALGISFSIDPIGAGLEEYRRCADQIEGELKGLVAELVGT